MTIPDIPVGFVILALLVLVGLALRLSNATLKQIERGQPRKEARYWQRWCWVCGIATGALLPLTAIGLVVRPLLPPAYQGYSLIPILLLLAYGGGLWLASYKLAQEAGPYRVRRRVWRQQYAFAGMLVLIGVVLMGVLPISGFYALL